MSDQNTDAQIVNVWWKDITLWTNVIAVVALILNNKFGFQITPEMQASILAVINIVLKIPRMAATRASAASRNKRAIESSRGQLTLGL